ncbi:hypothetical protein NK213_03670 [Sebaldella sp. S0638]|nr:hypothetical protein [Sebaldella sp. S0638]
MKKSKNIIKNTAEKISRGAKTTVLFIPCSAKVKSRTNIIYIIAAGLANTAARSFKKDKDSIFDS